MTTNESEDDEMAETLTRQNGRPLSDKTLERQRQTEAARASVYMILRNAWMPLVL